MAGRTIGSLVTATRALLQDKDAVRYSDENVLEGLNQMLAVLRKNRPDAYTLTFGSEKYDYGPGDMGAIFPLDQTFVPATINYMVAWCELQEDQYTADGRAAALMSRLNTMVNGLGV